MLIDQPAFTVELFLVSGVFHREVNFVNFRVFRISLLNFHQQSLNDVADLSQTLDIKLLRTVQLHPK